jgi:hypothetical protein
MTPVSIDAGPIIVFAVVVIGIAAAIFAFARRR